MAVAVIREWLSKLPSIGCVEYVVGFCPLFHHTSSANGFEIIGLQLKLHFVGAEEKAAFETDVCIGSNNFFYAPISCSWIEELYAQAIPGVHVDKFSSTIYSDEIAPVLLGQLASLSPFCIDDFKA